MILINVLPDHLRPIKRTPLPYIVAAILIGLALSMVGWLYAGALTTASRINTDIRDTEAALTELEPVVDEYNALTEQQIRLKSKIETIQDILSDRKIWSEHLHTIAELLPDNFWLSEVKSSTNREYRNVTKLDEKGNPVKNSRGEVQTERKTVYMPILDISGYVINDENGESDASPFTKGAAEDPEFSEHFKIIKPSIEDSEFDGFFARKFTFRYQINSTSGGEV